MKKKVFTLLSIAVAMATMLTGCTPSVVYRAGYSLGELFRDENDDPSGNNGNNGNAGNAGNNGNNNGNNNTDPGFQGQENPGVVNVGPNVIRHDTYYNVVHSYNDVDAEEVAMFASSEQNYKILGGYAYHTINNKCTDSADYDYFNNKSVEYAIYEQMITGYSSSYYESVVPVYIECITGYSDEFADNVSCFTGKTYYSNDDNPFYNATSEKKQGIHDELIEYYGEEVGEEYYNNYLTVLSSYFIMTYSLTADPTTEEMTGKGGYGGMYFVEVDDNGEGTLYIADVLIDVNTYEMNIQNPNGWLKYDIAISEDGKSYMLTEKNGFSLTYEKATDHYLIGNVLNESSSFHDIVGIKYADDYYETPSCSKAYNWCYDELKGAVNNPEISLKDGSIAVDPIIEFGDDNTVTISFEAVYNPETREETEYSFKCTAEYGLIGFLHDVNNGFTLTDDTGTYYFLFSSYDDEDESQGYTPGAGAGSQDNEGGQDPGEDIPDDGDGNDSGDDNQDPFGGTGGITL